MNRQAQKVFTLISVLICLLFILFVINQTNQIVTLAKSANEFLGEVVLYCLLSFYLLVILIPIYMLIRLPKSLKPPINKNSPDYRLFITSIAKRLGSNPYLKHLNLDLSHDNQIKEALTILDKKADEVIKKSASTVFVTTAISQTGRLDAFVVLATQARLILQVAHIYNQRPSVRDFIRLYANVATTTFLAMELEDLDISEQIEPIVANVFGGSLASIVPGVNVLASFVTNSILDGSANAYLTLRVGVITKKYCNSLIEVERKSIRHFANVEAAQLLGSIVLAGSKKVSSAIWEAARKKTGNISMSKFNPFKQNIDEPKKDESI